MTKRQRDGYRAQRVYFGLWHRAVSLPGEGIFYSPPFNWLTQALCWHYSFHRWRRRVNSAFHLTFSTCYAHSNRQTSRIMIKQQLVLQDDVKSSISLFLFYQRYFLTETQEKKDISLLYSLVWCLLYICFLFSCLCQHTKGQNFSHSHPTTYLFLSLNVHSCLFHTIFLTHLMMWKMADMRSSL